MGDSSFLLSFRRFFPTWIIHTGAVLLNFQLKIGYSQEIKQAEKWDLKPMVLESVGKAPLQYPPEEAYL
jgi:hypothetical protein